MMTILVETLFMRSAKMPFVHRWSIFLRRP
jgi:hypothetical protein